MSASDPGLVTQAHKMLTAIKLIPFHLLLHYDNITVFPLPSATVRFICLSSPISRIFTHTEPLSLQVSALNDPPPLIIKCYMS